LSVDRIKDLALADLDKILRDNGKSLIDYPPMPVPTSTDTELSSNLLIIDEMSYDQDELQKEHERLIKS